MPPSRDVLKNKVRRPHLLAALWQNIRTVLPSKFQPTSYSLLLDNGSYGISWYNFDQNLLDTLRSKGVVVNEDE
jgi:hypothetical protein